MKVISAIAKILTIIGALNWGFVGFFEYDVIGDLFGGMTTPGSRVVFALIGLAGLYCIFTCFRCCRECKCDSNSSCCKK